MAPRKNAKQSTIEHVEKIAEAGDVSPPKKRKTTKSTSSKPDQEKPTRELRTAKLNKIEEQINEESDPPEEPVKKLRARANAINSKKGAVEQDKVKTTKKNKVDEDGSNSNTQIEEVVGKTKEVIAKRTRGKASTKKAGIDVADESELKQSKRAKKTLEDTENIENQKIKKKRNTKNIEVQEFKEIKSKAKMAKNKDVKDETKNAKKAVNNNGHTEMNSEEIVEGELEQLPKKGRSTKKKAENPPVATSTKTRSKAPIPMTNVENNAEETKLTHSVKTRQKKMNNDNVSGTTITKKSHRKKENTVSAIVNAKDGIEAKLDSENIPFEIKGISNSAKIVSDSKEKSYDDMQESENKDLKSSINLDSPKKETDNKTNEVATVKMEA